MDPRAIARRLIDLAAEAEPIEIMVDSPSYMRGKVRFLLEEYGVQQRLVHPAMQLVEELDAALTQTGWNPDMPMPGQADDGRWTFGAAMTLKGHRRDIHRGFLDPVRSIPILNRVPDLVVLYLITVDDGEDYLKREAHSGVGWHYHYLDWNERRSNVILCWDTRWEAPKPQPEPPRQRGLFVEKHADGGKPFTAHPGAWGERKRESMYTACETDLLSRDIKEYRCAANKSEPVYPPGVTLTPHPSSIATPTIKAANKSGGKGKKRRR